MSSQRGFSILEALVSMALFLVVLVAVLTSYESARRVYTRGGRKVDIQMNARLALTSMERQIRMAGYFPENLASPPTPLAVPIRVATNDAIAVYGDYDGSGTSEVSLFCLDGTNLRRTNAAVDNANAYTCSSGDIIAGKVTGLRFSYYDSNNNPIPSPPTAPFQLDSVSPGAIPDMTTTTQRNLVRRVVITLTTSAPGIPGEPVQAYNLVSDVWRRNAS